ncbi:MAG: DUF6384 family protein [Pseudomonadota bacterium]
MSNPDAKAFEDKLLTIDLVDGLRREQERLDAALADAGRMQELRTEIQTYYAQAGITVSDALIDKAIAERQAQRFTFRPPALGLAGRFFANCYIYRGYVGAAAAALAVASFSGWYADRQYDAYQEEQALATYRDGLQQQLSAIQASEDAVTALPATLPAIESALIPALPNWLLDLQASYQQARLPLNEAEACWNLELPAELPLQWSGEAELARCHGNLAGVQTSTARASQLQAEHRQLATAVTSYDLLQQRLTANPTLLEWNAVATPSKAAQSATAVGSNRQQFTAAVGTAAAAADSLSNAINTHTAASSCLSSAAGEASGGDRDALNDLLNEGLAFKQSDSLDGLASWSSRASNTCEFFNSDFSLRIVSERGEQTGTWRYYGNNRDARSYYIIVDAVTAGGADAEAIFESAEDQQTHQQSRFGVRVSERVFESVRRDKEDDGVIRNATIGQKPGDSLSWQLNDGFEPSFIAEW